MLPTKMLKEIDSSIRAFLWDGVNMGNKKARVAREEVCILKEESSLKLTRNKDWNKASMMKHIWNILSPCNSTLCAD